MFAGMSFTACGGPDDESAHPETAAREDAIWNCDGSLEFSIVYYSDASHTQWVGTEACNCDGTYSFVGKRAAYRDSNSWQCL
ncbi:hypothetical protein D7V97_26225 [Corallococcus sp. CA053C]|nr:hypothetical protein D7V97_26225 [Corallococcus sp. CA053C]